MPRNDMSSEKQDLLLKVLEKAPDMTWAGGTYILREAGNIGLLSKDPQHQLTEEEREEKRRHDEENEQYRAAMYQWLVKNEGPTYNPAFAGDRANGMSIYEVLEKMDIEQNTRTQGLLRTILHQESTGWGIVGVINNGKLILYGKKAVLITFRNNPPPSTNTNTPPVPDAAASYTG